MATREFSYRQLVFEGKPTFFPTIPLRLSHFGKVFDTDAMIDTGSTYSIFRAEVAEVLGMPIERGIKTGITTLREHAVGYRHKLNIQILEKPFECEVVFSRDLKFSLNLLGRAGFLDEHTVTFKQSENKIIVSE